MSPPDRWHHPAGSLEHQGIPVLLTPGVAGWSYCGLRVLELEAGDGESWASDADELVAVPLHGAFRLEVRTPRGSTRIDLTGRCGVLAGPTDVAYVPAGSQVTVRSPRGGRIAFAAAVARRQLDPAHLPAAAVGVEHRGTGPTSRQVRTYTFPDRAPAQLLTDRLLVCEVVTPGGHWSSYPPHKHDTAAPDESVLEEVYYFETADPRGFGYQQVSASDQRPIDVLARVGHGDVVLVPYGWHGPTVAAPGHDLYYLNVMAGPDERDWRVSVHPSWT